MTNLKKFSHKNQIMLFGDVTGKELEKQSVCFLHFSSDAFRINTKNRFHKKVLCIITSYKKRQKTDKPNDIDLSSEPDVSIDSSFFEELLIESGNQSNKIFSIQVKTLLKFIFIYLYVKINFS